MSSEITVTKDLHAEVFRSALRVAEHHAMFGDSAKAESSALAVVVAADAVLNALDSLIPEPPAPDAGHQS